MLVYVWSRRNPYVRMNFFGLLNFQAPFLPWVLMGFSLLLGNSIIVDLLGKILGSTFSIILLTNLFCHTCHILSGLHIQLLQDCLIVICSRTIMFIFNFFINILPAELPGNPSILTFLPKQKVVPLVQTPAIKILILSLILYFWLTLGIAVGHIYFFLEDVFPNQPGGIRILKTPSIL